MYLSTLIKKKEVKQCNWEIPTDILNYTDYDFKKEHFGGWWFNVCVVLLYPDNRVNILHLENVVLVGFQRSKHNNKA